MNKNEQILESVTALLNIKPAPGAAEGAPASAIVKYLEELGYATKDITDTVLRELDKGNFKLGARLHVTLA